MLLRIAKIFRFLLFFIIAMVVIVPTAVYLTITSQWGQDKLRAIGSEQLSQWLGTDVEIARLRFVPISTLTLDGVTVADDNDSTALRVGRIDARFELWDFLFDGKIIIDYASIDSLDLHLYRADEQSPLNIDRILKRVTKKDGGEEPALFDLRLNDVALNDCSLSYDVLSAPETPGRFNARHLTLTGIQLEAFLPRMSNEQYHVMLNRLAFESGCGFTLSDLRCEFNLTPKLIKVSGLSVELPGSHVIVGDMDYAIDGYADIAKLGTAHEAEIAISDGSYVYLPDLQAFVPELADFDYDVAIELRAAGTIDDVRLELEASDARGLVSANVAGRFVGLRQPLDAELRDVNVDISARESVVHRVLRLDHTRLSPIARNILTNIGDAHLKGSVEGRLGDARFDMALHSALAGGTIAGSYKHPQGTSRYLVDVDCDIDTVRLGTILGNPDFNRLSGTFNTKGEFTGKRYIGDFMADISKFDYRGHTFGDITVRGNIQPDYIDAEASVKDAYADLSVNINGGIDNGCYRGECRAGIASLNLDSLNLKGILPGLGVRGDFMLRGEGTATDNFTAYFLARDLSLARADGRRLVFDAIEIDADNTGRRGHLMLSSDYVDASVNGPYNPKTLPRVISRMVGNILPAFAGPTGDSEDVADDGNNFAFDISLTRPDELCEFFGLPVTVVEEAGINGNIDGIARRAYINIEAPWIINGDKVIENTALTASLNGADGTGVIYGTSLIPTKKGDMEVVATINGHNGVLDTNIDWEIIRAIPINGKINFRTGFSRDNGELEARVDFDNSEINFGDELWNLRKSTIRYAGNTLYVDNLNLSTLTQAITVSGVGGPDLDDELVVSLRNIRLIDIFETLEIDNAMIGGYATGRVTARGLLGKEPQISSEHLQVKDIGYNHCTLGDADVNLALVDDGKRFKFDADVVSEDGRKSYLDGYIYIPNEELYLNIRADHIKVGFMKPFMSAFTSDVQGYASGRAELSGTFKDLDMQGDIYADSLRIKIDFTNTWYSASDSIHIRPGRINLENILLHDEYGNTALLNGWVGHYYFHNATFEFNITDAHRFLCYDVTEKLSPDWFGRVFGTGRASVRGRPGVVDIDVNMSTTANSVFTFVLSDREEAAEYSFITFRDITPRQEPDPIINRDTTPAMVKRLKERAENEENDSPTAYNMDIVVDITPQAQMVIVMDPVGGDRIKAYGRGNIRMRYESADNDLRLWGTYTLERGDYNFTLQDIIIKEFIIKDGSSIAFNGDPYSAQLDINAYYQVNANLSDLDESFLQDKELNRTNVPVRALLLVKGDMRQPDISFDLEFPSLSTDTYRKVRSIVSTEDMMNRQIIYLLALNRFYTPEYMSSTTKGNELFSVASSTIASQLSSMLGKLSENWSIAPNLRSDRGDFSDLEVDLTLSSSLLNNRLLFNGNFGYRDKSLNTNQFVGDFDIEALLNRSGSWRFKAYNRYNDQNYYLRTAQTTQGIGLVYRRDFDNMFSFLRRKHREEVGDSVPQMPVDTITINETITITDSIK